MKLNEQALICYCEFLENGFFPDNFVIPSALKACAADQFLGFGKGIHGYLIKVGFDDSVYVASSLVDMYGKCGVLEDAKKVFDEMSERNVVVWNSMIVGYVQNGMNEEAIQLFYEMRTEGVELTRVTMSSLLSASANLGVVEEGRQGHALAVIYGLEMGNILGSSLINFYSKIGWVEDAELEFSRMVEKDAVTWNLLISCYVQNGLAENAVNMCRYMRLHGLRFDCVTMASLISACADTGDIKFGREGHCYCIRNNLDTDVVAASMVNMYAKSKEIDNARRVFEYSVEKDLVLWNALLAAYAELGLSGRALELFYQMQLQGYHPNVITWNSILLALLRNHLVDEAKNMFLQMRSAGIEPNVITWTTLITGLAQNGLALEAILFFQQMQESGVQPNTVSLTGVLLACIDMTSLLLGKSIHGYVMRRCYESSIEISTSLVDMYAKCGCISHARKVSNMSSDRRFALYNAT
uniref:Pentatricopeptide repeat-containing protein n=1 Tax=Chenopodium quinoa TaxID=63459 RepID=A0A803MQ73_CHEQI